MNYQEIDNFINNIPKFKKKPDTLKAKELLKRIGFDESRHKIIHVAGTNGKGSVCAYFNSILLAHGYTVGLFTSPHLVKINERIRINGADISDELLSEAFLKIKNINEAMISDGFDGINYFDFFFGIAMYCFKKTGVEYVILETGIGGIYDSTNSIEHPIISVITSISFDHTEVLGNTIAEIASAKAGIIKDNVPVAFSGLNPDASEVFKKTAAAHNSSVRFTLADTIHDVCVTDNELNYYIDDFGFENTKVTLSTSAIYQADNSALVLCALSLLHDTCGFLYDKKLVLKALKDTLWQGRMEYVEKNIYVDGAHNEDGIRRFIESMRELKKHRRIHLLFTAVKEKNTSEMINEICTSGLFDSYVITTLNSYRAIPVNELSAEFLKYSPNVISETDITQAYLKLKSLMHGDDIAVCAGSLYLVGDIKAIIQ